MGASGVPLSGARSTAFVSPPRNEVKAPIAAVCRYLAALITLTSKLAAWTTLGSAI